MNENQNVLLDQIKQFDYHEELIENDFPLIIKIYYPPDPLKTNQEVYFDKMYLQVPYVCKPSTQKKEKGEPDFGAIDNLGKWYQYKFCNMIGGRGRLGKYVYHQLLTGATTLPL